MRNKSLSFGRKEEPGATHAEFFDASSPGMLSRELGCSATVMLYQLRENSL